MRRALFALLPLVACGDKDAEQPADSALQEGVVSLVTRDGVTLAADYYPAASEGRPALVLLHMVPPDYDRTSWPADFIELLRAEGWGVIVPDRRGAGDSGGEATDAYRGEGGRFDVEACVDAVMGAGASEVALLGASNGTTSALDYAAWSGGEGLQEPSAVGFMTGGTYTENQTPMSELPIIPAVFTYSTLERDWSESQRALDPLHNWTFLEYEDGAHGTGMFAAAPRVETDLVTFFRDALER